MPAIRADNDSKGQFAVLHALLESHTWGEFWKSLNFDVAKFEDLGLAPTTPDAVVWQACQERQIVLITSNRNAEGPGSLEETLRARNDATSLPVITLADPQRLMESKAYAERTAVRLLEYLMDLENYRGAGRLYIP